MTKTSSEYYQWITGKLYTAVLADVMDKLGYREQVLAPSIRPLYPGAAAVGRAATMLAVDTYAMPAEPYKLEMDLMDDLKPGEVVVCTWHGKRPCSIWGELLSTCVVARGGRGAIIDGYSRDGQRIIDMGFPTFCTGLAAADSMGRCEVVAIRVPVQAGGVLIQNGDLIVGDFDGVVVVPQAIEDDTVRLAMEKVSGENIVRDELSRGASIRKVFKQYGIL
jgi:4-hydroxy-4-methyl-2-oxoglutarate aldolase